MLYQFRGLSQLDDEEASQPARAASPDPPEYTTARAPDPVPRVVVGGGPPPRKSAPRPLTPPRPALGDALDDLAAAQAQLDAILGAPPPTWRRGVKSSFFFFFVVAASLARLLLERRNAVRGSSICLPDPVELRRARFKQGH